MCACVLGAGFFTFTGTHYLAYSQMTTPNPLVIIEPPNTPTPMATALPQMDLMAPLQAENGPAPRFWDGNSPVNLLLLGVDKLSLAEPSSLQNTDVILLVRVDPQARTAAILALPATLWVPRPNLGYQTIGTAYQTGGAHQIVATLENLFEIPISFYALLDYNTFMRVIDEIGGLKLNLAEPLYAVPSGNRRPQTLTAGVQTLPGDLTLAYLRALPDPNNPFERIDRLETVLRNIPQRINQFELLSGLIETAPSLYPQIANGMETNLNLAQVLQFTWLATRIAPENITFTTLGPDQLQTAQTANGETILRPIPEEVFALRDQIFGAKTPPQPALETLLTEEGTQSENAAIELRNGSSTPGLAAKTDAYLSDQKFRIAAVTNAENTYTESILISYNGKPYTVRALAKQLNISSENIFYRFSPNPPVDILVILGRNWAENNPMP